MGVMGLDSGESAPNYCLFCKKKDKGTGVIVSVMNSQRHRGEISNFISVQGHKKVFSVVLIMRL